MTTVRRPRRPGVPAHVQAQWERWQSTPVACKYLSHEARAQGYTVLHISPRTREVFLELLPFLLAYDQVAKYTERRDDLCNVWRLWQPWTRRLTAYLTRLAKGLQGTLPHVPEEVPPWHD